MRKKYAPLSTSDDGNKAIDDHVLNFKTPFTYSKPPNEYSHFVDIEGLQYEEGKVYKQGLFLRFLTHFLTLLSYSSFVVFFPILYFICIKNLKTHERMVIFRLGKMIGSRGPGRILVFPWLDRCQKVDVSDSAFSVPPQQLITNDGGIIEIGAEIQYGITDVVVMVREVADHQDILRSLGKTVLVRLLAKKQVSKLAKEKTICANEIMSELNRQVQKWGLNVRCVSLSETKVLKKPEHAGIGPVLTSLGLQKKEEKPYPSPIEFARNAYNPQPQPIAGAPGANDGESKKTNSEINSLDVNAIVEMAESGKIDWRSCIETVLSQEQNFEEEAYGLYCIHLTLGDSNSKKDILIQIGAEGKAVKDWNEAGQPKTDVSVNMTSSDLAGILKGSLPPLQAYLTGRITTSGDVRKLMLFDKISNRSHTPGATFNL